VYVLIALFIGLGLLGAGTALIWTGSWRQPDGRKRSVSRIVFGWLLVACGLMAFIG
jgi:hypothetical protein